MNIQLVTTSGRTSYSTPNSYVERLLVASAGEGRGALQAHIAYVINEMWRDFGFTEETDDKIHLLAQQGNTTPAAVITYAITRYSWPKGDRKV